MFSGKGLRTKLLIYFITIILLPFTTLGVFGIGFQVIQLKMKQPHILNK